MPSLRGGDNRGREVIVKDKAWIEDAKYPDRLTCASDVVVPPVEVRHHAVSIVPFAQLAVRPVEQVIRHGHALTVYEIHPPEYADRISARVTLDAQFRVHGVEIKDVPTGSLHVAVTAWPDPTHRSIVDPSDEPIISPG